MQLKIEQTMYSTKSNVQWIPFGFSSAGVLYSSLKKRRRKMTRSSNCRAANFRQIERAGVLPESPG